MKLTCSKCEAESEHNIAVGPRHYEYTCEKCNKLMQGDLKRTGSSHGSISVLVMPCNCTQQKPNTASFWDSEALARARTISRE